MITYLKEELGEKYLIKCLVDNFFKLGEAGESHADESWAILGLDTHKRAKIGRALQALLEVIDQAVEGLGIGELCGFIRINNSHASFSMQEPNIIDSIEGYQVAVT